MTNPPQLLRLLLIAFLGLLAGMTNQAQPAFLKEGLIAYYPFNGNANDESGNNNHATIVGELQFSRAQDTDKDLAAQRLFENQYISLPNELLRVDDLATTISVWCLFPSDIELEGNLVYLNGPNTAEHAIGFSKGFGAGSKSAMELRLELVIRTGYKHSSSKKVVSYCIFGV